jgi:Asp-tRNA(Asn)/Glu-tRNA(Gln) amidotransferase A subunit family amidase
VSEPCDLSASEARRLIGRRALSPVELLESCLARIDAVDHAVNAMVALDRDGSFRAAREAEAAVMRGDPLPALHGLPIGIKDLEDTAGLRTTYGSTLFRDHVPNADQRSVAAVRAAGAIVLGKTNTPEWGAGANTRNAVYGATGNPFDPSRSAAGSSGGSAVALACGMVPLATGTDTGGSLRNPAAFCGIVGFRPSPGVVPSEKHLHGWSPLAVHGPMARTVPDLALLFSAMVGEDRRSPLSATLAELRDLRPPARVDLSRLRVAATPDFGFALVERRIADTFRDRVEALRPFVACIEEATPDCSGTDEAFSVLRGLGFVAAHGERVRTRPDDVAPNIRANVAEGLRFGIEDVARAFTAQTAIYRRWQAFFSGFDVILTPSLPISPPPWRALYPTEIDGVATRSYYHWLALPYAVSLVGHPALSLPVGLDSAGMPFGLQIVGARGADGYVLSVAAELEQLFASDARTSRPVPNIAKLHLAPPIAEAPGFLDYD